MRELAPLRPRTSHSLRTALAAELAASALSGLPVGVWQRRLAARAFSLSLVPPVPRHGEVPHVWHRREPLDVWGVATAVAGWCLVPWPRPGPCSSDAREARRIVRLCARAVRQPLCVVVFVGAGPAVAQVRRHLRLSLVPRRTRHAAVAGAASWAELAAVIAEAAAHVAAPSHAHVFLEAARQLERVEPSMG